MDRRFRDGETEQTEIDAELCAVTRHVAEGEHPDECRLQFIDIDLRSRSHDPVRGKRFG